MRSVGIGALHSQSKTKLTKIDEYDSELLRKQNPVICKCDTGLTTIPVMVMDSWHVPSQRPSPVAKTLQLICGEWRTERPTPATNTGDKSIKVIVQSMPTLSRLATRYIARRNNLDTTQNISRHCTLPVFQVPHSIVLSGVLASSCSLQIYPRAPASGGTFLQSQPDYEW